jgi:hypothetical protein
VRAVEKLPEFGGTVPARPDPWCPLCDEQGRANFATDIAGGVALCFWHAAAHDADQPGVRDHVDAVRDGQA